MNSVLLENINNREFAVKEDTKITGINYKDDINLNIEIKKNCILELVLFTKEKNKNINLKLVLNDNSKFVFRNSFICNGTYNLNINTNIIGNNTLSDVKIRGINEKNGNTKIIMNGINQKNTTNNTMNEYAKILNKSNNNSVIIPNLLINSYGIDANHGASIGTISKKELFYVTSKGIDEKKAIKLIESGFILSIMNDEKELIRPYL